MPKEIILWGCETCGKEYQDQNMALHCEAIHDTPAVYEPIYNRGHDNVIPYKILVTCRSGEVFEYYLGS